MGGVPVTSCEACNGAKLRCNIHYKTIGKYSYSSNNKQSLSNSEERFYSFIVGIR